MLPNYSASSSFLLFLRAPAAAPAPPRVVIKAEIHPNTAMLSPVAAVRFLPRTALSTPRLAPRTCPPSLLAPRTAGPPTAGATGATGGTTNVGVGPGTSGSASPVQVSYLFAVLSVQVMPC